MLGCWLCLNLCFSGWRWGLGLGGCVLERGLGRELLQRGDGSHALGREHAPALQLPVLVLLQQHRTHQAGNRRVVGEDSDHAGTAFDFLIDALEQVGAPDLSPVLVWEVAEGEHVFPGLDHELCGPGEALGQGAGQVIPTGLDLSGLLLGEHRAQRGGDHALMGFGHPLQQVAGEMDPAALPAAALQHPPDCIGEALVGVADDELDPRQPALFERADEVAPERRADSKCQAVLLPGFRLVMASSAVMSCITACRPARIEPKPASRSRFSAAVRKAAITSAPLPR